ncbi:hypothetical protein Bca52824_067192 [Brassica carinata]|uniref:Calcineurin-like phosphoesterase domain-containing protein n=1 Tax=Brassica carinata TaxID=52824 RepID=A0A8X7QNA0_BRACI|nr:hypothetical protein Bca52824_067192 [Brassica carinata]
MASFKPRTVICIGDIHGNISKLDKLWLNLHSALIPSEFSSALVIFLGDYCDRGPHTRQVIDFLIALPEKHPDQTHVFLAGNHDFSFAGFMGLLPRPSNGSKLMDTWNEFEGNEEREGWYKGQGYEDMHVQDLMEVVPESHKKFLTDMVWVHEEEDVYIETEEGLKQCKLIAVHAGLDKQKSVNEQLELLRAKDTSFSRIQPLSGRKDVTSMPQELVDKQTIVVSGHHGKLHIDGLRLIIDESGGYDYKPLAAIILPSKKIIRDTDIFSN